MSFRMYGNGGVTLPPTTVTTQLLHGGFFDYNDMGTTLTPINVPNTGLYVDLTNDGLGNFTNKNFKPDGVDDIWNSTTNRFDFSQLKLGDMVNIRLDIEVTTTQPNQLVDVDLELGVGASPYDILFNKGYYKTAGANDINRFQSIYMGDNNTLLNPARMKIRSDDLATVVVRGWYCQVIRLG